MTTKVRRAFDWYETFSTFFTLAPALQTNIRIRTAFDQGAANLKGSTVTRLIGWIVLAPTVQASLVELAYGVIIVNVDARIAGALPDADDPTDRADWMLRGRMISNMSSLSDSSQWDRNRIDNRAQRIMRSEEDELVLILNASSANNNNLNCALYMRALLKLPA